MSAAMSSAYPQDIDRRVPKVIAWCDEHCYKGKSQDVLDSLTALGASYGMTVMAFKKAYNYLNWLTKSCEEHPGGMPHILITDWREFKPCNILLRKVQAGHGPSSIFLWLDGWSKHSSAVKAIAEMASTSSCTDFRLVHSWGEVSAAVRKVGSPVLATCTPKCAPRQPQRYQQKQYQPQQYQQQQQHQQQQQYQQHYHQPQASHPPQLFATVATTSSPSNSSPGSYKSTSQQRAMVSAAEPRGYFNSNAQGLQGPQGAQGLQGPTVPRALVSPTWMPGTSSELPEMTMTTLNSDSQRPGLSNTSISEDGNDMQQNASTSEIDTGTSLSAADASYQGPANEVDNFWQGIQETPHVSNLVRLCFPGASRLEVAAALQAAITETVCYHD